MYLFFLFREHINIYYPDITPEMREIGKLNLEIPADEDISKLNIKVKMLFGGFFKKNQLE
jgi:hypothetical protein